MTKTDQINEVLPQIQIAARRVAAKWPEVVEVDDVVSMLTLHFLNSPGALDALVSLPGDKRTARLTAIGHERAASERSAFERFSGQFRYSVDEVKKLLDRGGLEGHVDGFNSAVEDLSRASSQLRESNDRYHELVWNRYVLNAAPKSGADREALSQAIESLTTIMNKVRKGDDYDYTNGYRNNRQARNATELDYSGVKVYDD